MTHERIGLFGGTFDPIHHGHLIAAQCIAEELAISRVMFIPAAVPPHKPGCVLTEGRHRLEMVRLAIDGEPLFEASDVELRRGGPSYSLLTVRELRQRLGPDIELAWIIGADSLTELATWFHVEDLVREARIVTAARPGWEAPGLSALENQVGRATVERLLTDVCHTPRIEISATDIRHRAAAGRSIRYLVPDAVADYVLAQNLYSGAGAS